MSSIRLKSFASSTTKGTATPFMIIGGKANLLTDPPRANTQDLLGSTLRSVHRGICIKSLNHYIRQAQRDQCHPDENINTAVYHPPLRNQTTCWCKW